MTGASGSAVELSWVPPIRTGAVHTHEVCDLCQLDGSIVQYAFTASSPSPAKSATHWAPHQATGAPDAEACLPSTSSWMPDVYVCDESCYIVLGFKYPVIPKRFVRKRAFVRFLKFFLLFFSNAERLRLKTASRCRITVWVSWNGATEIRRIELMSKDGSSHVLSDIAAFCDMPYTREIHMEKLVTKVDGFHTLRGVFFFLFQLVIHLPYSSD